MSKKDMLLENINNNVFESFLEKSAIAKSRMESDALYDFMEKNKPGWVKKVCKPFCSFPDFLPAMNYFRFSTYYAKLKEKLMELLRTDKDLLSLIKRDKVKACFIGYTFLILQQNCHGTKMEPANKFLDKLGGFNYEDEVVSASGWMLPLTGSLYNDIRANFVAKKVKPMPLDKALELLSEMLDVIIAQVGDSVLSSFDEHAILPFYLTDNDSIMEYSEDYANFYLMIKQCFAEDVKSNSELIKRNDALKNLSNYIFIGEYYGEDDNYSDICNPPTLLGSVLSGPPSLCGYDTRLLPADKASHSFYKAAIVGRVPEDMDPVMENMQTKEFSNARNNEWLWNQTRDSISFNQADICVGAALAPLCDRERLEWERQREEIVKRRKAEQKAAKQGPTSDADKVAAMSREIESLKAALIAEREKTAGEVKAKQKLSAHVSHLEKKNDKLTRSLAEAEDKVQTLTYVRDELEQERSALLSMLAEANDGKIGADDDDKTLDTSVFDDINVVCFGGFPAWASNMRTLHPNITIYESDGPLPEEAIDNADVVWMQINSMEHKHYYRLINRARLLDKPVKYFTHSGHGASKRQMVREMNEMFKKKP